MKFSLAALLALTLAPLAQAGGGPENVLLVVNQNSERSKLVANEYVRLRDLPASNVVYVNYRGGVDQCPAARFRKEILSPVLKTIDERKLSRQIDCVAYSVDLPWRILMKDDHPDQKFPKNFHPFASITGCTFLYQHVMQKNQALFSPVANEYMPGVPAANLSQCEQLGDSPSQGFRSRYYWSLRGKRSTTAGSGERYLLSTMLGVCSGRGMKVEKVVEGLARAKAADGTDPDGTFYFMRNGDIRSKTRHACYAETVELLKAEGAKAVIVDGILPRGKQDVLGITTGKSNLDIAAANMRFLPGALGDNLTSYGGDFLKTSQTPLTHFLEAGATGSSGTVFEPTAMQAKFPLPTLHVHYRRGCSLAEAYYQSISCPYQLLVVGDPLCQPWAKAPQVEIGELGGDEPVSGVVTFTHSVEAPADKSVAACEIFVDGTLIARMPAETPLPLNTDKLTPGFHELRIVAIGGDPIETQGRDSVGFVVQRGGTSIPEISIDPDTVADYDRGVQVSLAADADTAVEVVHNGRVLATIRPGGRSVKVAGKSLGRGPARLQGRVAETGVHSRPAWVVVR